MSLQLQRVDVNHDLPVFATVGRRYRGARNARNLVSNLELEVIVKLCFVEPLTVYREKANGQAGRVYLHYNGGERSFGKSPQVGHRKVRNVRDVGICIGAWLEINLDQAHAGHRS